MNYNLHKSNYFTLFLCIFLLHFGCTFKTKQKPENVFESFITAIYENDEKAILSFIHPNSREKFKSELSKHIKWYESLRDNTKLSKPRFLKLDWIKRGSLVKVVYTHSGNLEDYLPMVLQKNKWWIDFGDYDKSPLHLHEIEHFVPGK